MRGVGGPLLCIGDLLSDIADSSSDELPHSSPISGDSAQPSHAFDLTKLFEENFKNLNEALADSDPSWTALTLKLCSSVETASKLVQTTNSNTKSLSEKVGEFEEVVKRGDAAVAAARGVIASVSLKDKNIPTLKTPTGIGLKKGQESNRF